MSSSINAIIINGYVGKELTLEYLNRMLIDKGVNVMYLKINGDGELIDICVKGESIDYRSYKMDEIIFDESDIFIDIYSKMKCDVLIAKSSKYNLYFDVSLYVITKCTNHMLEKLTENSFLSRRAAIITSNQSKEIISKIYGICNKLKILPFISEHFHYSYIKYNTGINMDYSYLSFILALNSSEIFSLMKIDKSANHSFPKVKIYDAIFYKVVLPAPLQVKITLDNKYYTKIIEKYNVRFFCNSVKTASAAAEISEWFSKNSKSKNVKICIFHMSPSLELIDIVNNLCTNKYNSVYIIDYDEIGFNYRSLVYLYKYNTIPESNSNWTETVYESFSRKVNRNITIDNPTSVIDWIFKYSGLHDDTQFDVLCAGSKKMIDDIISKIN